MQEDRIPAFPALSKIIPGEKLLNREKRRQLDDFLKRELGKPLCVVPNDRFFPVQHTKCLLSVRPGVMFHFFCAQLRAQNIFIRGISDQRGVRTD